MIEALMVHELVHVADISSHGLSQNPHGVGFEVMAREFGRKMGAYGTVLPASAHRSESGHPRGWPFRQAAMWGLCGDWTIDRVEIAKEPALPTAPTPTAANIPAPATPSGFCTWRHGMLFWRTAALLAESIFSINHPQPEAA